MPSTRAFKSGSSQTVRIPAELACADTGTDLTITRTGDVITIFRVRTDLNRAIAQLRAMPTPAPAPVQEPIELPRRAWE